MCVYVQLGALCGFGCVALNICAFVWANWAIHGLTSVLGVGASPHEIAYCSDNSCRVLTRLAPERQGQLEEGERGEGGGSKRKGGGSKRKGEGMGWESERKGSW